jgi:hypothetical protein
MYSPKIVILFLIFLAGLYFYVEYGFKSGPRSGLEGLTTINGELRCPNILIQKGAKYYLYNSNIDEVPGVNPIMFNNLAEYTKFLEWQRSAGIRCPVLYVQNSYDAQGNRVYKMRPSVSEPQGGLPSTTINTDTGTTGMTGTTGTTGMTGMTGMTGTNSVSLTNASIGATMGTSEINNNSLINSLQNSGTTMGTTAANDNSNILLVDANRNNTPYNTNSIAGFDQTSYYVGTTTPLDSIGSNANLLYKNGKGDKDDVSIVGKSANAMDANWGGQDFTQTLINTGFYKDNEVNILVP